MSFSSLNECVIWANDATPKEKLDFFRLHGDKLMEDVDNRVLSSACVLLIVFSKCKAPNRLVQHAKKAWELCVDNILLHDSVCTLYIWELNEQEFPFLLDLDRPKLIRTAIFAAKEVGTQKKVKWKTKLWASLYLCIINTERHVLKTMFTNKFVKMLAFGTLACVPTTFANPGNNCSFINIMAICLNLVVKHMELANCGKRCAKTNIWRRFKKPKTKKRWKNEAFKLVEKPDVDQSMFAPGCVSCLVHCAVVVSKHSGLSLNAPALPAESFEIFSKDHTLENVVSELIETVSELDDLSSSGLAEKSVTDIPFAYAVVLSLSIPAMCTDMFAVTSWLGLLSLSKNPLHSTVCVQVCLQMCFRIATWNTPTVSRAALRLDPLSNWVTDCPKSTVCTQSVKWLTPNVTRADVCRKVCELNWGKMCPDGGEFSETWHTNMVVKNWRKRKGMSGASGASEPPENVLSFGGHVKTPAECFVCCGSDAGSLVILAPCGHCMCCLCAPHSGEACYVCKQTVSCVVNKVFA
jgi:hypothetical protein